jgi:hypothetical protein
MFVRLDEPATERQLRWFSGIWFPALCGVIGWMAFASAPQWSYILWSIGALLGALGLAMPRVIAPVYRTLMVVTFPIGWVVSHLMLRVMYYLVITPIGWLVRRFYDPMERRFDRGAESYWYPREQPEPSRYFRQF